MIVIKKEKYCIPVAEEMVVTVEGMLSASGRQIDDGWEDWDENDNY